MTRRLAWLLAAAGLALAIWWVQGLSSPPKPARSSVLRPQSAHDGENLTEPQLAAGGGARPPQVTQVAHEAPLAAWLRVIRTQGALSDDQRAQLAALEAHLLEDAENAEQILAQLAKEHEPAMRERLFNLLRQFPGAQVETALVHEATRGTQDSTRTIAMEALAARKTPAALQALAEVAEHDSNLPAQPLLAAPRTPDETSTELPDEQVYTPRMQAMAALATTKDSLAVNVLVNVTRTGPDESLRMEAARLLADFRTDAAAQTALRSAAASDPSAYVRLAALHSLQGSEDPLLVPVLERVANHDHDAGVRILAQRVLSSMSTP